MSEATRNIWRSFLKETRSKKPLGLCFKFAERTVNYRLNFEVEKTNSGTIMQDICGVLKKLRNHHFVSDHPESDTCSRMR